MQQYIQKDGKRALTYYEKAAKNKFYHAYAAIDPDNLWMVAQAIRNQSVLEIEYQKLKDHQIVKRTVEPVGLMFSEYYFYLMGVITDHSTREAFHKKNDPYPTIYRLDRIRSIEETGEKFSVPYKDRFKEGEYKNRTQFMFGGETQTIRFNYYGPSVEAVLDKFPMAKVVDKQEGVCSIEAEVFGTGVKMWLLSQGSKVKVTAPETLVQEMKQEIEKMDDWYVKVLGKVATGELTLREGFEKMQETTVSTVAGLASMGKGAAIGGAVGLAFGPVGAAVGGFVGGTVAYMAGSKVGELAVKGARKVFEVGKTVVKKVAQKAADIGSRVLEHVGNLVSNFAGFLGF